MPCDFPKNLEKQLITCGTLALYHQAVLTDKGVPDQRSWRAYDTHNPITSRGLCSRNKLSLVKPYGMDREHQGEKMRLTRLNLFRNNKI